MKYTIKKGKHRARPITFGFWIDKDSIEKRVMFYPNCSYIFEGEDSEDINKLFGIGYFWSHHKDSARFGWRYDKNTDKIKIFAYCYVDKKRIVQEICSIPFMTKIICQIVLVKGQYIFNVTYDKIHHVRLIPRGHNKLFSYPLGLYFGGNKEAPHDMNVEMQKL